MADDTSSKSPSKDRSAEKVQQKSVGEKSFDPKNLVGQTLDARYELERCIGRGGMGVVYLASQSALDRKVVVKVLPPSFINDEEAVARFEREARGMSRLQHPHIVSIYDFGYQDEQAYIVMEYVEGVTLRRLIKSGEPMTFATFGAIALQVLEGIGEAHSLGLVHRDIKPSNIMLTEKHGEQNYVKILDFGLAKLVKGARDVTKEQNLVGSVAFLSPEQIMGNDTDQRVDVYALGVLFYYMLAGEKPFDGDDDVAVLYQHVHNDPEPLEQRLAPGQDIPQPVIDLIHRALSKDPAGRPGDAGEFLREFGACLEGTDISSPHVSGEFNAVSRVAKLSSLSPDDPSDRIERQRRETPIYQVPSDATPSNSGLVPLGADPSSGQVTWVSGEHLLKVEQQNRLRNILLGVLGALILGGGGYFLYTRNASIPDEHDVRSGIEHAVELTDEGKLGQADNTLQMLDDDLDHYPDLKGKYAAAKDHLAIAQLLAAASVNEDDGDIAQAIRNYQKVLTRDPSNETARTKLHALRAKRRQADEPKAAEKQPDDAQAKSQPTPEKPEDGATAGARPATHPASTGTPAHSAGARPAKSAPKRPTKAAAKKATSKHVAKRKTKKKAAADKSSEGLLLPSDDKSGAKKKDHGSDLLPTNEDDSNDDLLLH